MEKESNQKICLKSGISTNQKKKKKEKKKQNKNWGGDYWVPNSIVEKTIKQELWGISCNSEDA